MSNKTIARFKKLSLRVRSFGNAKPIDFARGRQGKDIKKVNQFIPGVPSISINSKKVANSKGYTYNFFNKTSLGLGQNLINTRKDKKFKDFIGIIDPVTIIKSGGTHEAYPIIHNGLQNNDLFLNSKTIESDGCIEVFPIRLTNINDIAIKGISGFIGVGNQFKSNTSNQIQAVGSEQVLLKQPVTESSKRFFLDAQESLFSGHTFPSKGNLKNSGKIYSIDGFVGFQKNLSKPFSEDSKFKNKYNHLTVKQRSVLLKNSGRDVSEIGTNHKSLCKGFIASHFDDRIVKTNIGTDSIAFVNLMKG